jgi:hypothetical protein
LSKFSAKLQEYAPAQLDSVKFDRHGRLDTRQY